MILWLDGSEIGWGQSELTGFSESMGPPPFIGAYEYQVAIYIARDFDVRLRPLSRPCQVCWKCSRRELPKATEWKSC